MSLSACLLVFGILTVRDYDGSALYWVGPGVGFSGNRGGHGPWDSCGVFSTTQYVLCNIRIINNKNSHAIKVWGV